MSTNLIYFFYRGFRIFTSQKKKGYKKELKWIVIEVIFLSYSKLCQFLNFFKPYLCLSFFFESLLDFLNIQSLYVLIYDFLIS